MKTVMQELIEWCNNCLTDLTLSDGAKTALDVTIVRATDLLEKEKQRMFHCFNAGADRVCDKEFNEWFDQNYNLKVPPCSGHAFEEE